jgi:hypothetical protein
MTPDERRQRLAAILDRHNDLARALRRTADMHDASQDHLEQAGRALRDATHAQREAIDGMLAANAAALALYNDEDAR